MSNQNSTTAISVANTISSSTFRSERHRPIQNYLLVWLDANIDKKNEDFQYSFAQLRKTVFQLEQFTDVGECIKYFESVNDQKIFLIISGSLGEKTLPVIHHMTQLDTIFVFCFKKDQHKIWTKQWSKVKGVHGSIKSICKKLKKAAYVCDHDAMPMSIISKRVVSEAEVDQENLGHLPPSYMYSVLFKSILLKIEDDDAKSLHDLADYCRKKNISEYQINNFKSKYYEQSAIWWYSCEMFIYPMLNRALRLFDMEVMIKMGFFIRRLHRELEKLHEKQSNRFTQEFIVYRGQGFSKEDFEHLSKSKGGFISFNNFLSTSKLPQMAERFARLAVHNNPNNIGVFFIMKIDPTKISSATTPYAMIDKHSAVPSEQEILFTMHTVFLIDDIKQKDKNNSLWEVCLTLIDEADPELRVLTDYLEKEIKGRGWYRMGRLMLQVRHLDQAEELYNELLEQASDDHDRADIYHHLGCLKNDQGKYDEAVICYQMTLQIQLKMYLKDDISLAPTYSNLGLVYSNIGNNSKALEFYKKANQIWEKTLPPNHPDLATSYSCISLVHRSMGNYLKALKYQEKSLRIKEMSLPSNHPNLANAYSIIGMLYDDMGDYSKSLKYQEKSIKIKTKVLPPDHPNLATSYNSIGLIYNNMGNYSKALEYQENANKIYVKVLSPDHPTLAMSYHNIGLAYNGMDNYEKALEYYEKANQIHEKALPHDHPDLATSYQEIGTAYFGLDNYEKALEYYEKALAIKIKVLPADHPNLSISYNGIGLLYKEMGKYSKAIEYYEKANGINRQSLPHNHPHTAAGYSNIAAVYDEMGEYSKALDFLKRALPIFQKSLPPNHINIINVMCGIEYMEKKLNLKS